MIARFDKMKAGIITFVVAVLLILFSFSFTVIPSGYTGVRTIFGQINEETAQNGFNWKVPFMESIERVNNKQQDIQFNDQIWSETANRTAIYYQNITVTYQISKDKSAWIYANVTNYKDSLVTQALVSSAIKSSSKKLMDTDATNRSKIEPLVLQGLQDSLNEKYGEGTIYINKIVIGGADFEESYNQAIAAKQNALLEQEKQEIINKTAVDQAAAQAEADVKAAEGAATKKRITAEAEAEALLIEAEAQAKANKELAESLTPELIEKQKIDKWNGDVPMVQGDSTPIINMTNDISKEE